MSRSTSATAVTPGKRLVILRRRMIGDCSVSIEVEGMTTSLRVWQQLHSPARSRCALLLPCLPDLHLASPSLSPYLSLSPAAGPCCLAPPLARRRSALIARFRKSLAGHSELA